MRSWWILRRVFTCLYICRAARALPGSASRQKVEREAGPNDRAGHGNRGATRVRRWTVIGSLEELIAYYDREGYDWRPEDRRVIPRKGGPW